MILAIWRIEVKKHLQEEVKKRKEVKEERG